MLSCSLLFSDPFFLLNTLHYSLIFRLVKQFFKKYYVFSLKIVKIYFLTQKTRIFIIEEKAQNQKASYNEDSFAMLDDVLDWCETYQVYAVVDFHAATAGQSGEFRVMTAWTMDSICMTMKNRWSGCFF